MFIAAIEDILEGLRLAPVWLSLGWQQTVTKFRRTVLGPFWLSVNLLAIAFALTILYGGLTGATTRTVFASLITGLLSWTVLGAPIGESAGAFISAGPMMQSQNLPLSFHIYLVMYRAFINFVAQLIALWGVFLLFRVGSLPAWPILIGLPLVMADSFLACLIIAMPSTRFRDVNQLVGFVMQIAFFVTPVFWSPLQMSQRYRFLLDDNPFAHLLELIRQPLLGNVPTLANFGWGFSLLIVLGAIAIFQLAMYRKRVIYWL